MKYFNCKKQVRYPSVHIIIHCEPYLNINLSFVLRKTLSSFRCSAHDLMIEKGRHLSIDRHLRFCPLCVKNNISVVEDEYHFFF